MHRDQTYAGRRLTRGTLEEVARAAGVRVIAALAARYRNLDLAEEAFSEACARAAPYLDTSRFLMILRGMNCLAW